MSEELQSGDAVTEIEAAPAEDLNQGADLATATEPAPEKTPEVDEAAKQAATQDAVNKRIGTITHQARQAERERDDLQAKVAKFESDQREAEAARVGEIPPIPDEFDDEFKEKMVTRDNALVRQAQFNASQQAYQQNQQLIQQQAEQQQALKNQQTVTSHRARAAELQISESEMVQAEANVMNYRLPADCLQHILQDSDSPLIIKHLAANPNEGMELSSMSPYLVGSYIDGIKAKAEALKPKQSNTPAPVETISGSGAQVDLNKFPNSKGAKFK